MYETSDSASSSTPSSTGFLDNASAIVLPVPFIHRARYARRAETMSKCRVVRNQVVQYSGAETFHLVLERRMQNNDLIPRPFRCRSPRRFFPIHVYPERTNTRFNFCSARDVRIKCFRVRFSVFWQPTFVICPRRSASFFNLFNERLVFGLWCFRTFDLHPQICRLLFLTQRSDFVVWPRLTRGPC